MCGSSGSFPQPPARTEEENSITREQLSLLQQQQKDLTEQRRQNVEFQNLSKDMSGLYDRKLVKKGEAAGKKIETVFNKSAINNYRNAINKYKNAPERIAGAPESEIPTWVKEKLSQNGYDINRSMDEHNQTKGGRSNPKDPARIFDTAIQDIEKDKSQWGGYGLETTQEVDSPATMDEYESILNEEKMKDYRDKLSKREQMAFDQEQLAYDYSKKMYGLLDLSTQRQEKALKGELPLSEATKQQKLKEFQQLKETVARSGGGIDGDTPETAVGRGTAGNEALGEFTRRWGLVEDTERRGEITSGGQMALAQYGATSDVANRRIGTGADAGPGYAFNAGNYGPGATIGGYGSLVSGYGNIGATYAGQRQFEYGGLLQNYQQQQQNQAGMYQLYGQAAGAGLGIAALASSKTFKKDILEMEPEEEDKSLSLVSKGKVYKWNYKGEKDGARRHMSLMAEEAPDGVRTPDGKHLDVGNYLGMLHSSIKALDRKVMSLSSKAA